MYKNNILIVFMFNPCRVAGDYHMFVRGFRPSAGFARPWVSPVRGFRPRLCVFNPCRVGRNFMMLVRPWVSLTVNHVQPLQGWEQLHHFQPLQDWEYLCYIFNAFNIKYFLQMFIVIIFCKRHKVLCKFQIVMFNAVN